MLRSILIAATITAGLAVTVGAAGMPEPLVIRPVTLAAGSGPAYYSVIEQGYRLIGGAAGLSGVTLADNIQGVASEAEIAVSSLVSHDPSMLPEQATDARTGN